MLAGISRASVVWHSHCSLQLQVKRLSLTLCLAAGQSMRGTDLARQECRFKGCPSANAVAENPINPSEPLKWI